MPDFLGVLRSDCLDLARKFCQRCYRKFAGQQQCNRPGGVTVSAISWRGVELPDGTPVPMGAEIDPGSTTLKVNQRLKNQDATSDRTAGMTLVVSVWDQRFWPH